MYSLVVRLNAAELSLVSYVARGGEGGGRRCCRQLAAANEAYAQHVYA